MEVGGSKWLIGASSPRYLIMSKMVTTTSTYTNMFQYMQPWKGNFDAIPNAIPNLIILLSSQVT